MKYIGSERHGIKKGSIWYVDIIGFIPQSDIVCQIRDKGNRTVIQRRYHSINLLLKNWDRI